MYQQLSGAVTFVLILYLVQLLYSNVSTYKLLQLLAKKTKDK